MNDCMVSNELRKHTASEAQSARSEYSAGQRMVMAELGTLSSQVQNQNTTQAATIYQLAKAKRDQDDGMVRERNPMAVAMAENSTINRIQEENMANSLEYAMLLTDRSNALEDENKQLMAENSELKRKLSGEERHEERPSQRLRITLPQGGVTRTTQDDVSRTTYGDLEKILVFQPATETMTQTRIQFARLHPSVKDALLEWSRGNKLNNWYQRGLQRRTSCVGTARRDSCIVPLGSSNVACKACVSKKAFCIRRWSSESESLCLYPLHEDDRGQNSFESVAFWIRSQKQNSKELYKQGEKLTEN